MELHLRRPELTPRRGDVDFIDCPVHDTAYRPALRVEADKRDRGAYDGTGNIPVQSPHAARAMRGLHAHRVDVQVTAS